MSRRNLRGVCFVEVEKAFGGFRVVSGEKGLGNWCVGGTREEFAKGQRTMKTWVTQIAERGLLSTAGEPSPFWTTPQQFPLHSLLQTPNHVFPCLFLHLFLYLSFFVSASRQTPPFQPLASVLARLACVTSEFPDVHICTHICESNSNLFIGQRRQHSLHQQLRAYQNHVINLWSLAEAALGFHNTPN